MIKGGMIIDYNVSMYWPDRHVLYISACTMTIYPISSLPIDRKGYISPFVIGLHYVKSFLCIFSIYFYSLS
jgi:hypothetical protein